MSVSALGTIHQRYGAPLVVKLLTVDQPLMSGILLSWVKQSWFWPAQAAESSTANTLSSCAHLRHKARIEFFDTSCFSGEYVTGDVTPEYLANLERERSDDAKARRRAVADGGDADVTPRSKPRAVRVV